MITVYKRYREQINYIFFGGCTTLINILVYWFATRVFGMGTGFGTTVGWILSVSFAYITNKLWVFDCKTNSILSLIKEIWYFFFCRILTYLIDFTLMYVFVNLLYFPDMLIKIIANIIVIVVNYVFSKVFIFNREKE